MPLKAGDAAAVEGFARFMGSHLKNTLASELVFIDRVKDFSLSRLPVTISAWARVLA